MSTNRRYLLIGGLYGLSVCWCRLVIGEPEPMVLTMITIIALVAHFSETVVGVVLGLAASVGLIVLHVLGYPENTIGLVGGVMLIAVVTFGVVPWRSFVP